MEKTKKQINKKKVTIISFLTFLLVTIITFAFNRQTEAFTRKTYGSSQTFFTDGANKFYVIIKGPSGYSESKLLITAKYNYNKNKDYHKATTAKQFRSSTQEVYLTGTEKSKGSYNIQFTNGNRKTSKTDSGSSYTNITFSIKFDKPAHQSGNGVDYDTIADAAHESNWKDIRGHESSDKTVTLSITISVYNLGLITYDNKKSNGNWEHIRWYGGSATYNLKNRTRTLTFDGNGGSVSPTTKTVTDSKDFGTLPTPTRAGYDFAGWYNKAGTTKYTNTSKTCGNPDLYAHWTGKKYDITYNANGGSGSMSNTKATYGSTVTLAKNAFTRQNYIFDGWATSAKGNRVRSNGESFTYSTTGGTTFYALWKRSTEKVTVKFDANGGVTTLAESTVVIGTSVSLPSSKVSRNGYALIGWSTNARSKNPEYSTSANISASNATYYAIWKSTTGNSNLANIITGDDMFTGDENLSGSNGTDYNSFSTDYGYAHPDGGGDNPGYYTEK